jgi:predicted ATP-grasp superfamily ATP-dependent carboligase
MNAPRRKNVIYVTPDIERAMGMIPQSHYRIVTAKTPYAAEVKAAYPDFVTLLENSSASSDTPSLLQNTEIQALALNLDAGIVVFKNNTLTESVASAKELHLLNPHAILAEKIENKVSQVEWLGELAEKYLPPHSIKMGKELTWNKTPYIFQWAHGHTGETTHLIRSEKDIEAIKATFPERLGRMSTFVQGPSFTVNAVVTSDRTLMGNISYQITGVAPFTDYEFSTIGNDWSLTHSLLADSELMYIETMVGEIGSKLRESGWRGLFGIDIMRDDEYNRIVLIEINARQPASTVFESQLQQEFRRQGLAGLTIFEAHIHALTDEPITQHLIPINDGSQIIQRVTKLLKTVSPVTVQNLKALGHNVIAYTTDALNSNILRIQSDKGIMETHNKFNARGKEILTILIS